MRLRWSRTATLVVRPRLYEPKPETLTGALLDVLKAIDVVYVQAAPRRHTKRAIGNLDIRGKRKKLSYDAWLWPRAAAVPSEYSLPC